MATLIVGLGSIGRRHAQVVKSILPDEIIIALRSGQGTLTTACPDVDFEVYSLEDALSLEPNCAIVASPAPHHVSMATTLVKNGLHVLIEKPLSIDLEGVDELNDLAQQKGLTVSVGYNLRFNPSFIAMRKALMSQQIGKPLSIQAEVGQNLDQWRQDVETQQTVSARLDMGGGAILELSHEFDYVCWLMGSVTQLQAMKGRLGASVVNVEDVVNIQCSFASGALGSIHLDMLSHVPYRFCRIIGEHGSIEWNAITGESRVYLQTKGCWHVLHPAETLDRNATYIAQWKHFLDCIKGINLPMCSLEDGKTALELCLAVKKASETEDGLHL